MKQRLLAFLILTVFCTVRVSASTLNVAQRVQGGNTTGSTTLAVTYGSTTGAGSLLVAVTTAQGSTHNAPTCGTSGDTFTQASSTYNIQGGNYASYWYKKNATANCGTVTFNYGGSYTYRSGFIYEVTGADTSSPFDQALAANGFVSSAVSTANFSLAASEEIIFAIVIGTPTISPGTGYTGTNFAVTGDATKYFLEEYHIVTANEAATATDGATNSGILAVSFKATAGGAATPVRKVIAKILRR